MVHLRTQAGNAIIKADKKEAGLDDFKDAAMKSLLTADTYEIEKNEAQYFNWYINSDLLL